jgi:hypothetical protein
VVTVTAEGFDGTTASDQAMAEFVLMGGGGDMGGGETPDETPAQTFYALTNSPGTGLASYQTDQPGMVETITVIVDESGAPFGDDLVGIDFRSSTGELYALADTGGLFTIGIEMATAAPAALQQATATLVGMTDYDTALDVSEGVAFDFNPQVDKIRVLFGANGRNFVTDPDTASTSEFTVSGYQSGDANDGMDPQISATGYTRAASPAPSMTTQYSIDSAADVLTIQAKNEGTLTTVGELGIDAASADGFDIYDVDGDPATDDGFAFLQTGGSLYSVDLSSGEATEIGAFPPGGTFTGIAVVPAE